MAGGKFVDCLESLDGWSLEVAAGIASHVLKRWDEPADREWFAARMQFTASCLPSTGRKRSGYSKGSVRSSGVSSMTRTVTSESCSEDLGHVPFRFSATLGS
jgi:hypothetical protein